MKNIGVTITAGPADWQIIQRDGNNCASLKISGYWQTTEDEFSVQLRLVNENDGSPVASHLNWYDATLDLECKIFTAELHAIPLGGLYRLETRLTRPSAGDTRPLRGDYRHHLGVGDIYLIAGQSNASGTGLGQAEDPLNLLAHLFANNEQWRLATHPLEDATATQHPITITSIFHGHSPWLSFARKLIERTAIPIGLVPCALGGSSIRRWVKKHGQPGDLFENMRLMADRATAGKIAGILWYQGESDCMDNKSLQRYEGCFEQLLQLFTATFGTVDIFTAQLNRYINPDVELGQRWSMMREIQRQFATKYDNVHLIATAGLPLSDVIHNSAVANVIIGQRFADSALKYIYNHNILANFPEPHRIVFTSEQRRKLKITFDNLAGNWVANDFIADFTVEDEQGMITGVTAEIAADGSVILMLPTPAQGRTVVHAFYGNHSQITMFDDCNRSLVPFSLPVKGENRSEI